MVTKSEWSGISTNGYVWRRYSWYALSIAGNTDTIDFGLSGISVFSTTFAKKTDYKAQLVYCPGDRVELYTSLPIKGNISDIIKQLINDETMFRDSDVRIYDYNT